MKVTLEIDHTVTKEEIESWINDVLLPNTPCVWGYSFEEHHCGNCSKSENAELKAKLKEYEKKEKLYSYLEGRFVECIQSCTQEEKEKCPMFPEFCEGEHTKFVDIVELLNKKGEIR